MQSWIRRIKASSICSFAWGLTPDPDSTVYITDGQQNDLGYSNPDYDAMKKGLNAFDLKSVKWLMRKHTKF